MACILTSITSVSEQMGDSLSRRDTMSRLLPISFLGSCIEDNVNEYNVTDISFFFNMNQSWSGRLLLSKIGKRIIWKTKGYNFNIRKRCCSNFIFDFCTICTEKLKRSSIVVFFVIFYS